MKKLWTTSLIASSSLLTGLMLFNAPTFAQSPSVVAKAMESAASTTTTSVSMLSINVNGEPQVIPLPAGLTENKQYDMTINIEYQGVSLTVPNVPFYITNQNIGKVGQMPTTSPITQVPTQTIDLTADAPTGITPTKLYAQYYTSSGTVAATQSLTISDFNSTTDAITFTPDGTGDLAGKLSNGSYTVGIWAELKPEQYWTGTTAETINSSGTATFAPVSDAPVVPDLTAGSAVSSTDIPPVIVENPSTASQSGITPLSLNLPGPIPFSTAQGAYVAFSNGTNGQPVKVNGYTLTEFPPESAFTTNTAGQQVMSLTPLLNLPASTHYEFNLIYITSSDKQILDGIGGYPNNYTMPILNSVS